MSSDGRTPQLSASTVVSTAEANASTSVGRGQRARAHGSPSARNGSAGREKPRPGSAAAVDEEVAAVEQDEEDDHDGREHRLRACAAAPEEPKPDRRSDDDRREVEQAARADEHVLQPAERRHADAEEAVMLCLRVRVRDVAVREVERRAERRPVVGSERERGRHGPAQKPERPPPVPPDA